MQKSYLMNYINIYIWQALSIGLNFLALFIVSPRLTSDPAIYGIYSICTTLTILLAYADLGFGSAGYKYASESFARDDRQEEMRIIGFVAFVMIFLVGIFIVIILYCSVNPSILIKNLTDPNQFVIAQQLLLILSLSGPLAILQNTIQTIFGIRLEDYIANRIYVLFNFFKILSVLYFFTNTGYNIVGYFLFYYIMTYMAVGINFVLIKRKYKYNFLTLFKACRFSKEYFNKTKHLALNSFISNLIFIFTYELDLVFIGNWAGPILASIYAVALNIQNFCRTLYGALFTPFLARFNHFIGTKDDDGLKQTFYYVLIITLPISIFPVVGLIVFMKNFVLSWVGTNYSDSILITDLLICTNIMNFLTTPTNTLLYSFKKLRPLYVISFGFLFLDWAIILLLFSNINIIAFALAKSYLQYLRTCLLHFLCN